MNYELIGIGGTLLILAAFLCNGEMKIRILDMIGAALFILYGILIGSFSNIVLNAVLIIIQVVKILRLRKKKRV